MKGRSVLLDFIPKSQKNKLQRVTYQTAKGPRRSMSYKASFTEQREKILWLLKQLDRMPEGHRFSVKVRLFPSQNKTIVELSLEKTLVGDHQSLSDPDGILVTVMDALKLSSRIADDGINHVSRLEVVVEK